MRISLCRCDRMESFIKYSVQANVEYLQLLLKIQFDWESTCLFSSNPRSRKRDHNWQNTLLLYLEPLSPRQHQSMWKAFYEKKKKQKKHTVSLMRGFISQSEHRKKAPDTESINLLFVSIFPHCSYRFILAFFFFPLWLCKNAWKTDNMGDKTHKYVQQRVNGVQEVQWVWGWMWTNSKITAKLKMPCVR